MENGEKVLEGEIWKKKKKKKPFGVSESIEIAFIRE